MKPKKIVLSLSIFGGALVGAGIARIHISLSSFLSATEYGKELLRQSVIESLYTSIPLIIVGLIIILITLLKNRSVSSKASPSVQKSRLEVPETE